ncbi:WXG100 family type VII secretion target [Dactylosporangium sp. CA-092794]|uniref:WXG100 family type VII secretion target n=1 Tax=Dactylosporangium sp. CA-092794 TaxID=3239929 RepID=UPI003D92756A
MPSISLDYEKITATAGKLNSAVTTITPMLATLKSDVSTLLGDGLVFEHSSPALQEAYEKFNTSLAQAISGITMFAEQFTNIKTQMEEMDTTMAASIRNGG